MIKYEENEIEVKLSIYTFQNKSHVIKHIIKTFLNWKIRDYSLKFCSDVELHEKEDLWKIW